MAQKNHLSKRHKATRRKKMKAHTTGLRRLITTFLFHGGVFGFCALTVYTLFFSSALVVKNIIVTGADRISVEAVQDSIFSEMSSAGFLNTPRPHLLFFSREKVNGFVLERFPEVKNVDMKKIFPDTIHLTIEEIDIIIMVCG